ncbi:hypothetical protein ACTG9Q_13190 [Actinokineospora sp. 24-640]
MSMLDDQIAGLRAELAGLRGAVRLEPLIRLAKALAERSMRNRPGTPAAIPDLSSAIEVMDEAHGLVAATDPANASASGVLGYLLGLRATQTGDERDRERAIILLDGAVDAPHLPVAFVAVARIVLGTQYLTRAMAPMARLVSMSPMDMFAARASGGSTADLDRAERHLHAARAAGSADGAVNEFIDAILTMCKTMRVLLGGGLGGMDFTELTRAFTTMRDLQQRAGPSAGIPGTVGMPDLLSLARTDIFATLDPLTLPVPVVEGRVTEAEAPVVPQPDPVAPVEAGGLRRKLRELLIPGTDDGEAWEAMAALLLPDAPVLAVADVDEAVALATSVLDHADGADPDGAGPAWDWFLLAVSLHLRDRVDGGGGDRAAGAEALLGAARKVPMGHPAALVVLRSLGAFLDRERPMAALAQTASGFTGRFDAVLAAQPGAGEAERAQLHALRCLCRAAWAVAELGRAAEALPDGFPWADMIVTAARSSA